jgi:hypothetical protein
VFSVGPTRRYITGRNLQMGAYTRVEAGSNTSTVTLRVVGGDEMGSLKSETSDTKCTVLAVLVRFTDYTTQLFTVFYCRLHESALQSFHYSQF